MIKLDASNQVILEWFIAELKKAERTKGHVDILVIVVDGKATRAEVNNKSLVVNLLKRRQGDPAA